MRTVLSTIFVLFHCLNSLAQALENCSQCATEKLSLSDIENRELYEIELLRNEIFARHQYAFKNQRLSDYFYGFDWYKPNDQEQESKVSLNAIEQHNISVFKAKEAEIKEYRKALIQELVKLKDAINSKNTPDIKSILGSTLYGDPVLYDAMISALSNVLNTIPIDQIHWYRGKAQYKITTDNGFCVSLKAIIIENEIISISITDPMRHSDLMNHEDAFIYPSQYYSEDENTAGGIFEFKNGKLSLKTLLFAG